jgi:ribosomal protein L11 methylase PrmA
VSVIEGDAEILLPLLGQFRVILANIISSVITQLLPVIGGGRQRDGQVLFSGVLVTESGDLKTVLAREGWIVTAEDVEGQWWSAVAHRG